jgi:AraC-like DNA-binding protein
VSFFDNRSGIFGPAHEMFSHVLTGVVQGLVVQGPGVRFRPGCFSPFLDRPVSSVTDTSIPVSDIFGETAKHTQRVVSNADSEQEMVGAVDDLLCTNVPILPKRAARAAGIVDLLASDPTIVRVDQLSAASSITVRTLQRLFGEHVGVSPKWAIRVYRFNDVALAADLGYSDQAHFTRDFTAAMGTSPGKPGSTRPAERRRLRQSRQGPPGLLPAAPSQ